MDTQDDRWLRFEDFRLPASKGLRWQKEPAPAGSRVRAACIVPRQSFLGNFQTRQSTLNGPPLCKTCLQIVRASISMEEERRLACTMPAMLNTVNYQTWWCTIYCRPREHVVPLGLNRSLQFKGRYWSVIVHLKPWVGLVIPASISFFSRRQYC